MFDGGKHENPTTSNCYIDVLDLALQLRTIRFRGERNSLFRAREERQYPMGLSGRVE